MQENAILVKLAGEISLKSDSVKKRFTETLKQNLVTALEKNKIKLTEIRQKPGRFLIFCNDLEKAQKILSKVFGIHSIALVYFFESKIKQEILETCANYSLPFLENKKTFAVKTKREGTHAFTSQEMSQELGGKILEQFPELTVNLKNAEQFVFVEIRDNWACVFVNELHALNGLPVGTAGVLALLWNNSQESILSCLLLLRRGCKVVIIFSKKPDEKKLILLKELSAWNSFRDLDWILFENLNTEKEKRKILALANPSIEVSLTSFGQDLDLFKQYNLVVLRPLNLFSKQMVKEKLTELMYLDF